MFPTWAFIFLIVLFFASTVIFISLWAIPSDSTNINSVQKEDLDNVLYAGKDGENTIFFGLNFKENTLETLGPGYNLISTPANVNEKIFTATINVTDSDISTSSNIEWTHGDSLENATIVLYADQPTRRTVQMKLTTLTNLSEQLQLSSELS